MPSNQNRPAARPPAWSWPPYFLPLRPLAVWRHSIHPSLLNRVEPLKFLFHHHPGSLGLRRIGPGSHHSRRLPNFNAQVKSPMLKQYRKKHPSLPPSTPSPSTSTSTLVSVKDAKHARRPPGSIIPKQTSHPLFLVGPSGKFTTKPTTTKPHIPPTPSDKPADDEPDRPLNEEGSAERFQDMDDSGLEAQENAQRYQRKKLRQWENWMSSMSDLVTIYIDHLYATNHLRNRLPSSTNDAIPCSCKKPPRKLTILCVFFDRYEDLALQVCSCKTAPSELLRRGFFACSPVHPTLAVDLRMLDFLSELYVRMPPNQTAWCDALEHVLRKRGHCLRTRDTLRKRFSNALQWYRFLVAQTEKHLSRLTASPSPPPSTHAQPSPGATSTAFDTTSSLVTTSSTPQLSLISPVQSHPTTQSTTHPPLLVLPPLCPPSVYLRERCPLCFGGAQTQDVIVCLDACFTQKRTRNTKAPTSRDPPRIHPSTLILDEQYVKTVEDYVNTKRGTTTSAQTASVVSSTAGDGDYEPGMTLPTSVLNECSDSFLAADERREKASTSFFADTGLMALLCRHDRVLWMANMMYAGERQFYGIALVKRLFEDLPTHTKVKLLYDIGCQTHRSFEKYDYLPEYRHRLSFAVSVFHAFGHQWPCQLLYHPRKCVGFGLSDGEGAERLWHSISLLIAINRVSGYFQRFFNLVARIRHLDENSELGFGYWLIRRWYHTQRLKAKAEEELSHCGVDVEELRVQWKAQVKEQTRPLQRQSKDSAKKVIDRVLALDKAAELYKADRNYLSTQLTTATCPPDLIDSYTSRLHETIALLKTTLTQVDQLCVDLGTNDRLLLEKLRGNEFLKIRLNMLALRQRILAKIRERKFVLAQLERACRRTLNENKLADHADQASKHREPGIIQLLNKHNTLHTQLEKMTAPKGLTIPPKISREGLFQLDVDDDIWQDVGFENESEGPIPRWLGDENVRMGIRAMLQRDRCLEEEERLIVERCSLQEWMKREWEELENALVSHAGNPIISHHLHQRQQRLVLLAATWEKNVLAIPSTSIHGNDWGPSSSMIRDVLSTEKGVKWDLAKKKADILPDAAPEEEELDEDFDDFPDSNSDLDVELVEVLESTGYAAFEAGGEWETDSLLTARVRAPNFISPKSVPSSNKRKRAGVE